MAIPQCRKDFITYCRRRLGEPVIKLNIDDDQVNDRVDEALLYFADYHFDGTDKQYYKYELTQNDIQNRYITLPDNIIGVVDIFDIGESTGTNNLFNIRYQIALNDVYTLNNVSIVPYYMALTGIQFLEQILVGRQPIRYNRHVNRLYVDMDWSTVNVGQFLVVTAYVVIDPKEYPKVWGDRWLARYATCLIKAQWGTNLKKFAGIKMPGGVEFNGQKIFDEAMTERAELEKEMIYSYGLPVTDQIG